MLDEEYGALGWKESYDVKILQENGTDQRICKCTLSVLNKETGEWISRDGFSSNMPFAEVHRAKAEASDALKLAAVQFGIGRELYSFDNIFAFAKDEKGNSLINIFLEKTGDWWTNDEFEVTQILYEDDKIKALTIKDKTTNQQIFTEDRRKPVNERATIIKTTKDGPEKKLTLKEAKATISDVEGPLKGKKLEELTGEELLYVYTKTKTQDVKFAAIAIAQNDKAILDIFRAGGIKI